MPLWTKKREVGVWDIKGKVGNSQVMGKSKVINKLLLGHLKQ